MSEIILGKLFLGSVEDAVNEKWLQENSISLVITVMNEPISYIEYIQSISICQHYMIPISDMTFENCLYNMDYICQLIDSHDKVLIHCMFGISRSSTITIAYLMIKYKYYLDDATRMVLKERPFIFPNDAFILQLIHLEKSIFDIMTYLPDKDGIRKYKRLLVGFDQ